MIDFRWTLNIDNEFLHENLLQLRKQTLLVKFPLK